MEMPKKSLVIKVAIAVAIVLISLILLVSLKKPKGGSFLTSVPSLIPATEGFEGDGMPEYEDVDYYVSEEDAQS
jgi:hypothetical protein